ncbi:FAD/FMN-containing dehydrogenase [Rhizobium sp. RU20A]|nr:FAD/FMN-containing dehydrogenase [Rhizobium sp. RU20A]
MGTFDSWGRVVSRTRQAIAPDDYDNRIGALGAEAFLPFGQGRSYGDSCHNDTGSLIEMRRRARITAFDPGTGILTCEAGVTLREVIEHVAAHRFFLAVTPGTAFATIGGAIANDVHGKNHHARGSFGHHVLSFDLLRSDGTLLTCSPDQNPALFAATIGGMGLTGVILSAQLQLMKVPAVHVQQHAIRFDSLSDYFARVEAVDAAHEYSVAWIDQLAKGRGFGRGILLAGDHANADGEIPDIPKKWVRPSVPFMPPVNLLNGLTLKAFNELYYRKARPGEQVSTVPWTSYFYPLDAIGDWNRLYGPRGLFQHQSVFPLEAGEATVRALMTAAQAAGHASFLTVLKKFGDRRQRGLLSFAREGFTLTLDFSNQGASTLALLDRLDAIVMAAGGAINPYKDQRMAPATFAASFPDWERLEAVRDPALMSDFWRRTAMALTNR